jgi:hypothetical protein
MFEKELREVNKLKDFGAAIVALADGLQDAAGLESRANDLRALKDTLEQQVAKLLDDAKIAKKAKDEAELAHVQAMENMEQERDALKHAVESERSSLESQIAQVRRDAQLVRDQEEAKLSAMVQEAHRKVEDERKALAATRNEHDSLKRALDELKRTHGLV